MKKTFYAVFLATAITGLAGCGSATSDAAAGGAAESAIENEAALSAAAVSTLEPSTEETVPSPTAKPTATPDPGYQLPFDENEFRVFGLNINDLCEMDADTFAAVLDTYGIERNEGSYQAELDSNTVYIENNTEEKKFSIEERGFYPSENRNVSIGINHTAFTTESLYGRNGYIAALYASLENDMDSYAEGFLSPDTTYDTFMALIDFETISPKKDNEFVSGDTKEEVYTISSEASLVITTSPITDVKIEFHIWQNENTYLNYTFYFDSDTDALYRIYYSKTIYTD